MSKETIFAFDIGVGPSSVGPLYHHPDGDFYGTAGGGAFIETNGLDPAGTIFKVTPSGQFEWQSFSGNSGSMPGSQPVGALTPSLDGWLWGSTYEGGVHSSLGTVFRFRPTTSEHQVISGVPIMSELTADGSGVLWGYHTTNGTPVTSLHRINDLTGERTLVLSFTKATGSFPGTGNGELYFDGTQFWGTTSSSGAHGGGTAFRFTPTNTAPYYTGYTTVAHFTGSQVVANQPDGFWPVGRLTPDGLGYLWGATRQSGNVGTGYGTIYKINMATGVTETVARFNGSVAGHYPRGSLADDGEGFLWGVTEQGGANAEGVIFKVEAATGAVTIVQQFGSLTGESEVLQTPTNPLTFDGHGHMWGMSLGATAAKGWGLYKVNIETNALTRVAGGSQRGLMPRGVGPKAPLAGTPNGEWMYGTTGGGGSEGAGTLFRHNPATGEHETLVNFTGNAGAAIGAGVTNRLHIHTDGTIWGTSDANVYGSVFKYDLASKTYTHVVGFSGQSTTGNPGQDPIGRLASGNDGHIYGVTNAQGNATFNSNGTFYRVNTSTGIMTVVKQFLKSNNPDGGEPEGGVAADSAGVIWGTTIEGGGQAGASDGYGTIFKYDPATNTFTSVVKFTGAAGAFPGTSPRGDIFFDSNGRLWGRNNNGVFRFDPSNNALTYPTSNSDLLSRPPELDGYFKYHDGLLFGVDETGGTHPDGRPAGGGAIYRMRFQFPQLFTNSMSPDPDQVYPAPVTLTGSVNLNGGSNLSGLVFEWGPTTALGRTIAANVTPNANGATCSATIPELTGLTSYYFRLRSNALGGPYLGSVQSFKTRQDNGTNDAEIQVDSPLGNTLVDNVTVANVGRVRVGATVTQAVIIRNLGISTLSGLTAALSGANADQFEITTSLGNTSLSPKYSATTLEVTYTPSFATTHTATLTITSNDLNEAPFEVLLSGTGVIEPDLRVELAADGSELLAGRRGAASFGDLALNTDKTIAFRLRNTGNGPLNDLSASIVGEHANEFNLTGTIPSTLAADGSSSVFSITFNPAVHGPKSAVLRIESNDVDEDPYEILLVGSGVGTPVIKVTQQAGGAEVISEQAVPYGNVSLGLSLAKTFVIENTGTAPLVITSTTFSGGMFTLISPPGGTVYPNESTTIVVAFTPTHALFQQPTYTINSNASNVAAFKLKVTGTGVNDIPDIKLMRGGVELVDGGGSVSFGAIEHPDTGEQSIDITNTGTGPVTGISASFAPGSSPAFKIKQAPAGSVAAGAFTGIVLTYKPTANGLQTATLQIASSDVNENPYEISLSGFGIGVPEAEIAIAEGATPLTDDTGIVALGTVPFGSTPAVKTFTISNSGTGPLSGINASFAAGSSADFKVTKAPAASVAMGASTTFTVTYKPTINGAAAAHLRVVSSDNDESPFDIHFSATGSGAPEPDIQVLAGSPATNYNSAATFVFTPLEAHLDFTQIFTIKNTGAASLTGVTVSLDGSSDAAFSLTALPKTAVTVAKNASTTFGLNFNPSAVGVHTAKVIIASNDPDEGSFELNIIASATATAAPLFTQHPSSQLVLPNQTVQFSAVASGVDNTYQWKKNGAAIKGATNSFLNVTTKAADVGAYTVTVKNATGENTSNPAYLGLVTLSQGSLNLKEGASFSLACKVSIPKAAGVGVTYSWRRSGNPLEDEASHIAGAHTATLKVSNLTLADSGDYTCLVTMTAPDGDPTCANGDTVVDVVQKPVIDAFTLPTISVSETVNVPPVTASFAAKFKATGLPPGVTLNATTGEFVGKPTAARVVKGAVVAYEVKVTATNAAGTSDPFPVDWLVNALHPTLVGTFNGLVARDSYTNLCFGGTIQVTTTTKGSVTGSVVLAGQKYPLTGVLDASEGDNPTALLTAKRNSLLGNLAVEITSIEEEENRLSGRILDENFEVMESEMALGDGTAGSANGAMSEVRLNGPRGLALQGEGGFIADTGNHLIRQVLEDSVSTFAGQDGVAGAANGNGASAQFSSPEGLVLDAQGNLYVADTGNAAVRKITPGGEVTTVTVPAETFQSPCALAFDDKGNLVVVDRGNHTLVKIATNGTVTVLAGVRGSSGHKDGAGKTALFDAPGGICFDAKLKAFFVADTGNSVIRKVLPTGAVSTYAGSADVPGVNPGLLAHARFMAPRAITSDGNGTFIVADSTLVMITPGGFVLTITGYLDEENETDQPVALAIDPSGETILAADAGLHAITGHYGDGPLAGASFVARRNTWTTTNSVALAKQGKYTASLTGSQGGDDAYPQGHGYVTLTVNKNGTLALAGKTPDGAGITASTVLGPDDEVILHQMLYKNTGSLQGMTYLNGDLDWFSGDGINSTTWYKVPQAVSVADRAYKAGFPLHSVIVQGGKYTPANNIFLFLDVEADTTTDNARISFSDGNLAAEFSKVFNIKAPNAVTVPTADNPEGLKLTIAAATGIFSGSFNEGSPARKVTFEGALVRNASGNLQQGRGFTLVPQDTNAKGPVLSGKATVTNNRP